MKEFLMARNALEGCLLNSALLVVVSIRGRGRERGDERDLHGEKCIGGVLYQFRALRGGYDNGSGDRGSIWLRDGIGALVVAAIGGGGVDFAENLGGSLGMA